MESHREAGFSQFEAWQMAREHHLMPEEPSAKTEHPNDPMLISALYGAMVEFNKGIQEDPDEDP